MSKLATAAWQGSLDLVKQLIEAGEDINGVDEDGCTALMRAIQVGNTRVAEFLLNRGARTELLSKENFDALSYAVMENNTELIRMLASSIPRYSHGSHNILDLPAMFCYDSGVDRLGIAKLLIALGAPLDGPSTRRSPLMWAIQENHFEVAKLLLESGCSPHKMDPDSQSRPIHFAAAEGRVEIVELLMRYGASPTDLDQSGATAEFYAAAYEQDEVIQLFRKTKA